MTLSGGKIPDSRRPRTRAPGPTNVDGLALVHAILQSGRELRQRLAAVGHARHLSDSELLLLWACSRPPTVADDEKALGEATSSEQVPGGEGASGAGHSEAGLAGPLGLSGGELSGMLYDLRDRGLVRFSRVPDGDTRQRIELSADGQTVLAEAIEAFNSVVEEWLASIPAGTVAAWTPPRANSTKRPTAKPSAEKPSAEKLSAEKLSAKGPSAAKPSVEQPSVAAIARTRPPRGASAIRASATRASAIGASTMRASNGGSNGIPTEASLTRLATRRPRSKRGAA